jgi:hypothetical protein
MRKTDRQTDRRTSMPKVSGALRCADAQNSVPASQKSYCVSVTKVHLLLMVFRATIAVYCESCTEQARVGKTPSFCTSRQVVHVLVWFLSRFHLPAMKLTKLHNHHWEANEIPQRGSGGFNLLQDTAMLRVSDGTHPWHRKNFLFLSSSLNRIGKQTTCLA